MSRITYTVEGFRAAFRRPRLTVAEIAWRWTVGATGCALLIFSLTEYLGSVPVSTRELLLLRSGQPVLIAKVIGRMLRGSVNRAVLAALIGSMALCGLWILAASIGRAVTVRGLLEYFCVRGEALWNVSLDAPSKVTLRGLVGLNFLRISLALAAALGLVGATILAGFASPEANPRPALAFLLFLPLAGLVGCASWVLNWLLSLASLFAVGHGKDTTGAISAALIFCRKRAGAVLAVSGWTELAHVTLFAATVSVISVPLAFSGVAPWRLLVGGMIVIALAYFAVADWLYMARLAGYVCIAEMPEILPDSVASGASSPRDRQGGTGVELQTSIDRDEPILSDLQNLVMET